MGTIHQIQDHSFYSLIITVYKKKIINFQKNYHQGRGYSAYCGLYLLDDRRPQQLTLDCFYYPSTLTTCYYINGGRCENAFDVDYLVSCNIF